MDVCDAVASRYSCRAFLDTPVPEAVVRDILGRAARAPSGGNLQPWRVHVLAGPRLAALKALLAPRMDELPRGEGAEYAVFPPALAEPFQSRRHGVGEALYRAIDVRREDRAGRYRQYGRNFVLFDAPVGLFFTLHRSMGPPQWSDLGMYIQTVMLLGRAHDLHSCAQEAWTIWHRTVAAFLPVADDHMVFCGMALGHADPDAAINQWRSGREPVDGFAVLEGFDAAPAPSRRP